MYNNRLIPNLLRTHKQRSIFARNLIPMQIFDFSRRQKCFYIIFSRPAGARNQFRGLFERSKPRYCRRILIFKDVLNKISLNLSFKLGTFCKFLQQE